MAGWVVAADFILYEENVLPLEETRQTQVEPESVRPDVNSC